VALFKIPHRSNVECVVLIVVVLITIVEILIPSVVVVVLGGTPIVVGHKTPTNK
jgi:membrane protein implicated in regulation of membrane protease activity